MSRRSKLILLAAGILAGLVIVAAAIVTLVLRSNAKPKLEAAASRALEMEVHVDGRLTAGFFPGLHATA